MNIFIVIIFVIFGILFLYLNVKVSCKINFTFEYINIYFQIIVLKNKFKINKKIYYTNVIKIVLNFEQDEEKEKNLEKYKYYLLKFRKYFRFFIIKNISLYAECFDDKFSIAIEFYIVNNILKKSLLNSNN